MEINVYRAAKKRYCQTEKKALALVWAVEHFKIYLYGLEKFELITDRKSLEAMLQFWENVIQ